MASSDDLPRICVVCDKVLSANEARRKLLRCRKCSQEFGIDSKTWCVRCRQRAAGIIRGHCPHCLPYAPLIRRPGHSH